MRTLSPTLLLGRTTAFTADLGVGEVSAVSRINVVWKNSRIRTSVETDERKTPTLSLTLSLSWNLALALTIWVEGRGTRVFIVVSVSHDAIE